MALRALLRLLALGFLALILRTGSGCGETDGTGQRPVSLESAFPLPWEELSNPVLADPEISLKDPCVVYHRGVFHIFTSGASYRTRDFKTYEGPFPGYGSPDITRTAEGRWRMIATARDPRRPIDFGYMESHEPFVYELRGEGTTLEEWTEWVGKRQLQVPREEWNSLMHANSAYLCNWREHDGHFYLFYAGTNQPTEEGRGHGRIGVVRSRDLVEWKLPGEDD